MRRPPEGGSGPEPKGPAVKDPVPHRRSRRLPALLVWILVQWGCGGATDHAGDEALQAELRLSPTPPMVGTAGVRVRATDRGEVVAPPGAVSVRVEGAAAAPRELVFEEAAWVGSLDFAAAGDVRVVVEITAGEGRSAVVTVPVRVARRP